MLNIPSFISHVSRDLQKEIPPKIPLRPMIILPIIKLETLQLTSLDTVNSCIKSILAWKITHYRPDFFFITNDYMTVCQSVKSHSSYYISRLTRIYLQIQLGIISQKFSIYIPRALICNQTSTFIHFQEIEWVNFSICFEVHNHFNFHHSLSTIF